MQMWILIRIIKRVPERVLIKKRFTESEAFFPILNFRFCGTILSGKQKDNK